jgi:hypothetical protein
VIISEQKLPICLCVFLSNIIGSRFILYYCREKLISFVIGKYTLVLFWRSLDPDENSILIQILTKSGSA